METTTDELKLGRGRPAMPFADARLLGILSHTLWFLPDVASCHAMANLLAERQNSFYRGYKVVVCAGASAGIGAAALEPVEEAMDDPLKTRTITLSCGKLTTGVTVRPWSGVFVMFWILRLIGRCGRLRTTPAALRSKSATRRGR